MPGRRKSMRFWKSCKAYGWILGIAAAFACLIIGNIQGQFLVIWQKAAMICLECIGIG